MSANSWIGGSKSRDPENGGIERNNLGPSGYTPGQPPPGWTPSEPPPVYRKYPNDSDGTNPYRGPGDQNSPFELDGNSKDLGGPGGHDADSDGPDGPDSPTPGYGKSNGYESTPSSPALPRAKQDPNRFDRQQAPQGVAGPQQQRGRSSGWGSGSGSQSAPKNQDDMFSPSSVYPDQSAINSPIPKVKPVPSTKRTSSKPRSQPKSKSKTRA